MKPYLALAAILAVIVFLYVAIQRGLQDQCTERGGHLTITATGRDFICVDDEGRVIQP